MKRVGLLVAVLAIFCMAGFAQAAKGNKATKGEKAAGAAKALNGVVASVDANGNVKVTPKVKKGDAATDLTVATDASTVVTIDGNAGKVSDITPGMKVKVTPTTGTATKIEATSKAAKGAGKGAGKNAKKPAAA